MAGAVVVASGGAVKVGGEQRVMADRKLIGHPQSVACDIAMSTMKNLDQGPAPVMRFNAVRQRTAADTGAAWIFSSRRRRGSRRSACDVRDLAIGNGVVKLCGARHRSASMSFA
jgi:hypothetical protein